MNRPWESSGQDGRSLPCVSPVLFGHLQKYDLYRWLKHQSSIKQRIYSYLLMLALSQPPLSFFISSMSPLLSSSFLAVPSPPTPHRPCGPTRATSSPHVLASTCCASPISPTSPAVPLQPPPFMDITTLTVFNTKTQVSSVTPKPSWFSYC